jgi:hypothetical protein
MKRSERAGTRKRAEQEPARERRRPGTSPVKSPVKMIAVESSALAAVGYDHERCLLHVRFRHTGFYTYEHVPPDVFEALLAADSKGRFYNQHIRNAFEHYRRLEPGQDEAPSAGPH